MLKEIRLKNFMIFKGTHIIRLNEHITAISSDRGSGKTTLAFAIVWCLTGKYNMGYCYELSETHLLNAECVEEMGIFIPETVEVELLVSYGSEDVSIKRVAEFHKTGSGVQKRKETATTSPQIDRLVDDSLIHIMIADGDFGFNNCYDAHWARKTFPPVQKPTRHKHSDSQPQHLTTADGERMSTVAERATEIFAELYAAQKALTIKWEDGFAIYRGDADYPCVDISYDVWPIFNLSIFVALQEVMIDQRCILKHLPVILDDPFMTLRYEDKFPIDRLLSALSDRQVVLLLHEHTLRVLNCNRFGIFPNYYFESQDMSLKVDELSLPNRDDLIEPKSLYERYKDDILTDNTALDKCRQC